MLSVFVVFKIYFLTDNTRKRVAFLGPRASNPPSRWLVVSSDVSCSPAVAARFGQPTVAVFTREIIGRRRLPAADLGCYPVCREENEAGRPGAGRFAACRTADPCGPLRSLTQ